jgi:predicted RND superfamily exporter protein
MEKFFKRPWLIVVVIAAITVFFALQLPQAQLDNNNFRFVPKDNPARIASSRIDDTFGSQMYILVGLERRYKSVLDADFLKALRAYGDEVSKVPLVGEVTSIVTTDYIGGSAEGISVEPLVPEGFTGSEEDLALVRDRLLEWDMYRRALVSDDFRSTQVLVELDIGSEDAGKPEVMKAHTKIKQLAERAGFEDTNIYVAGLPVLSSATNEATSADLRTLIPLVMLTVIAVLYLSFRRLDGVLLPLMTVMISATWSIGAMALFGVKLSILSTVLPVILVAVGSAYGIHVVSHYYDEVAAAGNLDGEGHRRLVFAILRRVGKPVMLAALTTFAGFGSLCFTSVVPIFEFGLFSSLGVIVAWLASMTFIPAVFLIRGPRTRAGNEVAASGMGARAGAGATTVAADPFSSAIADALCAVSRKRRSVIFVGAVAAAISIFGVSRIVIDNVLVEYFKDDTDVVRADKFIRSYFGGTKSISVVVSGEKPGDVLAPDVLSAMDGLSGYLAANVPEVGKTTSFTDLVKRINQVFNADESPEGLSPVVAAGQNATAAGGEPVFGFGASGADEPAFGFGAPPQPAAPAPTKAFGNVDSKNARATEALDERTMTLLLNDAIAKSGKRDMSAEELVAQLSRMTNYRGAAYYEIPTDPKRYAKKDAAELKRLIANYLVLLSGDIGAFADDPLEPKSIRMNVQLRTVGQRDTDRAIAAIQGYAAERFPKGVKVEIGGTALVEKSLNQLVVKSQLTSVASSLLMVFIILAIFYRSVVAGLLGLAPLAISILVNFAVMGAFGIKLNIGTSMVASIAVGVGIDYTIHYLASYHHEYLRDPSGKDFLRRTFLSSGKAILLNALSVGAGFAVLAFSRFNILAYLGALIALTMGTSALVSLTVLPALLEATRPAFIRKPLSSEKRESRTEVAK